MVMMEVSLGLVDGGYLLVSLLYEKRKEEVKKCKRLRNM